VNMLRSTETRDPHVRALQPCIKRIIEQIPQIDKRSVQEGMAGSVIIRVLSRRVIASVMSKSTGMPQPPPVGVPMTLPSLRSGRGKG
jgi:hypothetical protein